jgi:hypothetical protein
MLTRLFPLSPRAPHACGLRCWRRRRSRWHCRRIETGSSSTDENVFTTPPSAAYLLERLPAQPGTAGHPDLAPTPVEAFVPGDIIVGIDGDAVKTVDDVRRRAAAAGASAMLSVRARRTTAGAFVTGLVDARALAAVSLRDVARRAAIDVTAGGASDRHAGRRRDRASPATSSRRFEADARMCSGGAGAHTYDRRASRREPARHPGALRPADRRPAGAAHGLVLIARRLDRPHASTVPRRALARIRASRWASAPAVFLGATNRPGAQSLAQTVRVLA